MLKVERNMVERGLKAGLSTTWELAKIVVPTAIIVAVFEASGLLQVITDFFAPYMGLFGLSGAGAVVLFSGYFVNLYAAAGSILALNLPAREIAIVAVMLLFAHSLLVELPISQKAGSPLSYTFIIRLGCSLLAGIILGVILA